MLLLAKLSPELAKALQESLPGLNVNVIETWHVMVAVGLASLVLLVIEAVSFRISCSLLKAEVLDFLPSSGVIFVRTLVCTLICVGLWLVVARAAAQHHKQVTAETLLGLVAFAFLLCSIAGAIVHANMLDESLGKGLLIFWVGLLISAVLSSVVGAILVAALYGLLPRMPAAA